VFTASPLRPITNKDAACDVGSVSGDFRKQCMETRKLRNDRFGKWPVAATISPNNFKFKSLSNWAFNTAVGCSHACRFCYVPHTSVIKLQDKLLGLGVTDPDTEWGDYVYLTYARIRFQFIP
jgi:hypothetical protein